MASQKASTETETENGMIITESPSRNIRHVILNDPSTRNSLSPTLLSTLLRTLHDLDGDESVKAIVLSGSFPHFSSGLNIKTLKTQTVHSARTLNFLTDLPETIRTLRTPLLAAVTGGALGGGFELCLLCDIVHCGKTSFFAFPEINLGTIPGCGGTQRLPGIVGKSLAMELIMTGRKMYADEALRSGVVSGVHEDEDVVNKVVNLAKNIVQFDKGVLGMAKEAVGYGVDGGIQGGLKIEKGLYYESFGGSAFEEGVAAFIEKRQPNFEKEDRASLLIS